MIVYRTGNLLEDDAEVLVNTVNCVGVMGKGVALAFKRRFPLNFDYYKSKCDRRLLDPGDVYVFKGNPTIVNFATKNHWRDGSDLEWIDLGLRSLYAFILDDKVKTIAIPKLGCGNGGLDWKDVNALVVKYLDDVDCEVRVYGERVT